MEWRDGRGLGIVWVIWRGFGVYDAEMRVSCLMENTAYNPILSTFQRSSLSDQHKDVK